MNVPSKVVVTPSGERWPAIGLGTWRMGESASARAREVAAVREALEIGYRLIDTAEMYGEGGAEERIGEALVATLRSGVMAREALTIVSKVYPHNASRAGVLLACERSRRRLGVDTIDLYLLHWRGSVPLAETVAGFEALREKGWIRHWGVSNFDVDDLEELGALAPAACQANQVYYSLGTRGIEFDLLPWMRQRRMPVMAYSPIDQGALGADPRLQSIAQRLGVTAAQLALAWVLRQDGVIAIPKAVQAAHLQANFDAASVPLQPDALRALDRLFPPPRSKQALATT